MKDFGWIAGIISRLVGIFGAILLGVFEADAAPVAVRFDTMSLPVGFELVSPTRVRIPAGVAPLLEVNLTGPLRQFVGKTIWIRSLVRSSRQRTGVHFNNTILETFSYHSGDGQDQLLLSEAHIPVESTAAVLRLVASEVAELSGTVTFGPIFVTLPQEPLPELAGVSLKSWARTNNPNHDSWFDRYTSQLQNFSLTLPHLPGYPTWERYFGMGINDRFNTGDYFCYPDDVLYFSKGERRYRAFLGHLPWRRSVELRGPTLRLEYRYSGALQQVEDFQAHPHIQGESGQYWSVPPGINVDLKKEYIFSTERTFADVRISGRIVGGAVSGAPLWVVQDAAYMDFKAGTSVDVHSFVAGKIDRGGVQAGPGSPLIQFRLRSSEASLASYYQSQEAEISFVLPMDFSRSFLMNAVGDHTGWLPESLRRFELARPNPEEPWMFGLGFRFSANELHQKSFRMYFRDNFSSAAELGSF